MKAAFKPSSSDKWSILRGALNFSSTDITLTLLDSSIPFMGRSIGKAVFPSTEWGNDVLNEANVSRSIYPNIEGDVFFNMTYDNIFSFSNPGSFAFFVGLHEIGHSVGLKHTHDRGPFNAFPTLSEAGLGQYDSTLYSVMSYNTDSTVLPVGHSSTLMPFDILALQYIYGANTSTGSGNSKYELVNDFQVRTIYDVSGTDVITAANIERSVFIDLRPSAFSQSGLSLLCR